MGWLDGNVAPVTEGERNRMLVNGWEVPNAEAPASLWPRRAIPGFLDRPGSAPPPACVELVDGWRAA
jgi:hypothetical protein